ncbi:polysaccharide deacetylase family protein [Streptomyces mangrovisoli]|uniref:NodB homology domain-containing protein n=1 Tax=Streptomyces mangrovisoli TaxID=1428628 RepID=A0A1J4NUV8_9ACTN|nr:polysaccharide deacetylase family protein [Streptomyces mangrovisoli]OIJ65300.1 hypothetical protein WN71_023735 [Streptomyces mangrovisoli]
MALRGNRREPADVVLHDHGNGPEPCLRADYVGTAANDRRRGRHHGWGRGQTQWPIRVLLGALTLSVVLVSAAAGIDRYLYLKYVAPQASPRQVHITSAQRTAWTKEGQELPGRTAPVVLTFHDIATRSKSPYALTPKAFDEQLTALERAGYRTLTAQQFTDYMAGGRVPRRSVLLTFDDGTGGLWKYADRILAKHHMHATVFLITGSVDKHLPYYLTWREIAKMHGSGRWDFGSHTRAMHDRRAVNAEGDEGAALANRLWLPDERRQETTAEYRARVRRDLSGSVKDIVGHGLPTPKMFAIPFSDGPRDDGVGSLVRKVLHEYFPIVMTDTSSTPLSASRRAAAAGYVQRVEVLRDTSPVRLLAKIRQNVQIPAEASAPLTDVNNWEGLQDGVNLDVFSGRTPARAPGSPAAIHYVSADYRPRSSVDWTDYRAAAVLGSLGNGTNQASLAVRTNSKEPVDVVITQDQATLLVKGLPVDSRPLKRAARHTVTVDVGRQTTTVRVDGQVTMSHTSARKAAELSGGITIRSGINDEGEKWPTFKELSVVSTAPAGVRG